MESFCSAVLIVSIIRRILRIVITMTCVNSLILIYCAFLVQKITPDNIITLYFIFLSWLCNRCQFALHPFFHYIFAMSSRSFSVYSFVTSLWLNGLHTLFSRPLRPILIIIILIITIIIIINNNNIYNHLSIFDWSISFRTLICLPY